MDPQASILFHARMACKQAHASTVLHALSGTFLRGVLDKVGVEPQVQRIGAYKSAGDQLLRTSMSPEQREQLQALLDDTYADWAACIAQARGKSEEQVRTKLRIIVYGACDAHIGCVGLCGLVSYRNVVQSISGRE